MADDALYGKLVGGLRYMQEHGPPAADLRDPAGALAARVLVLAVDAARLAERSRNLEAVADAADAYLQAHALDPGRPDYRPAAQRPAGRGGGAGRVNQFGGNGDELPFTFLRRHVVLKTLVADAVAWETDDGYPGLESLVRDRLAGTPGPWFTTAAEGLFDLFLEHLPAERRQHYNCKACRAFVDRYGGLVTITDEGVTFPVLWTGQGAPLFFADAVSAVARAVSKARVDGVFVSGLAALGTPASGGWTHLSGPNPAPWKHALLSADQKAAERREEYGMLCRGLAEFPAAAVAEAVRVLKADALDRSEKTLGVAEWLAALHARTDGVKGLRRENVIWKAVATAPPGFCHVRSSMIGTLLEDIVAGLGYDAVAARWAAKMHPLRYQRPTTLHEGTIKQAEAAVAAMGSAGSLKRRFARLADVVALWRPAAAPPPKDAPANGVFGHLRAKGAAPEVGRLELPATVLTWEKFARDVLPGAAKVEFLVPHRYGPFFGLVTAADPDAPPVLQWDGEPRNPVSWYFYHGGSPPSRWGLAAGGWVPVTAVFLKPPHWHHPDKFAHEGRGAFLALEGAKDASHERGGGLFPECLRSEYHAIRSAIEAYIQAAAIEGKEEGDANGYALQHGQPWDCRLRVTAASGVSEYRLDRWD